ncbi:MAG: S9 family peptidase [Woeseia sp.]|nr:prolyl oligopeptidase family serine peptidase [Woeseia sp.]NNE61341.1 S9 family peptidase [Woeseia sp.]
MIARRCTLRALLLLLLSTAALGQSPLTLEEIVLLKTVGAVQMNPAGDRIAYTLNVPRKLYVDEDGPSYTELHVVNFQGNSIPYVTGKIAVDGIRWSQDGKSIYFLAKRDPEATVNSLYRIAIAGGEAQEIFTHVSSINAIFPSPDGKTIAFIATDAPPAKTEELALKGFKAVIYEEAVQHAKVWMLDLGSMKASAHELPGHASDFSWAADGERYAVALAPTPLIDDSYTSRDIHVVDARSGNVQNAMGSVGKLGHFEFSPDGDRIAYIGSVDINDPSNGRLYVASSNGGERRDMVPNYLGHVTDFTWKDEVTLRWLGARGVWTEWKTASIRGAREAGPAPAKGAILRSVSANPDQQVAAAVADAPIHPREVYLLRDGQVAKRLTNSNPFLANRKLARQTAITYEARDGLELEAILIEPFEKQAGGNPLVLFVHGGPEAHQYNGWVSTYAQPGQFMAAHSYTIAYPNYRGSTGRGVEFSKLGQHDYAEEEFDDLVDLKRHLVAEDLADAAKTGISGGSYGGYASMWAASALTVEFAASVAFVGISNQLSKFGTGDIPYEMYHVHARAWPWDDWMWMLRRSPVFHAGKTKTPLLIMGGDQDPRVHPSQSLEMYRFVKIRTDTPVRLVIYPGEVHGNRNTAARYDYALRLSRWMDHYLKGPGGAPPPYELPHAEKLAAMTEDTTNSD